MSDKNSPELALFSFVAALEYLIASAAVLTPGGIGCLNASGQLVPAADADTTLIPVGRTEIGGTGDGATVYGKCKPGVYFFDNSLSADLIAADDVRKVCYLAGESQVALTDNGGTRSKAGVIVGFDAVANKVAVAVGFAMLSNPAATPSGSMSKKTVTVLHSDLTSDVDNTLQAINIGTALPAGAVVVACMLTLTTQFTGGGASAVVLDVGWSGATEALIKDFDAFGSTASGAVYNKGASAASLLPSGPVPAGAKQLLAGFITDSGHDVEDLTAGSITIDVYYFVGF